jgi:hypothetical protein
MSFSCNYVYEILHVIYMYVSLVPRNWQHRVQDEKKHNTICVRQHYKQPSYKQPEKKRNEHCFHAKLTTNTTARNPEHKDIQQDKHKQIKK